MEPFLYSPSTGGFYLRSIHGDAVPGDAVEISADDHAALLQAQAEGKRIQPASDGTPEAVDPPEPPPKDPEAEKAAILARVRELMAQYDALTA